VSIVARSVPRLEEAARAVRAAAEAAGQRAAKVSIHSCDVAVYEQAVAAVAAAEAAHGRPADIVVACAGAGASVRLVRSSSPRG
jgi:NAD(P)-dependent dehydrogenase (short-subunit alcohol dehydrogenase family)